MLGYILSFFSKIPKIQLLSLGEAYARSEYGRDNEEKKSEEQEAAPEEELKDYETFVKIGRITDCKNTTFIIDDFYTFESDLSGLYKGSKISYQLIKTHGRIEVTKVHVVENDWDVVHEGKRSWCTRTIICKAVNRIERIIILSPNNIELDLNKIRVQFIPIIGDWVELEVKAEINEDVADLAGEIIEIDNVRPVNPQVKVYKITNWNSETRIGTVNRNIWFNEFALSNGYVPVIGDTVVCSVIESEQANFALRALKIIPNVKQPKNVFNQEKHSSDIEEEIPGVWIPNNLVINLNKLGDSYPLALEITNERNEEIILEKIETPKSNQIKILNTNNNITINPKTSFPIHVDCVAKNIGDNEETLIFYFDGFQIKRSLAIVVNDDRYDVIKTGKYVRKVGSRNFVEDRDVVRGERIKMSARFAIASMPAYAIPQRILDVVLEYADQQVNDSVEFVRALEKIAPILTKDLTFLSYENKFHTLVHLDECVSVLGMMAYDQERACFIRCAEFLLLEIENLSERRPSIIPGDKVIAQDIYKPNSPNFEGIVHKVGAKHVFLKFSSVFHDFYNGEDYRIKIVAGRTVFRREHFAIGLAVKNLGQNILFPSKVVEKDAQVNYLENIPEEQILRPIQSYKGIKNGNIVELQWMNKNLNHFQKQAVRNILDGVCRPLPYLIFGPPGTGKTVTLVETILQLVRLLPQVRLLVSAPSNSAADLIAMRLIDSNILKPGDLVRLVSYNAIPTLPAKLAPYSATATIEKEGTETDDPIVTNSGLVLGCNSASLGRHKITVCTCSSAGVLHLLGFKRGHFTHIVIDEAGQTSEPSVMIPLSFLDSTNGQAILAGDPMQLGPVILSTVAAAYGLEESYLERLMNRFPYTRDPEGFRENNGYDPRLVTKLVYNYRAIPSLLQLPSSMFYHNDLIATLSESDSIEAEILKSLKEILPAPKSNNNELPSVVFHGVIGENCQTEDCPSWFNPKEAAQVFFYVNELYRLGLSAKDIGIITPYKAQTRRLTELFNEAEFEIPKIGTVDEFQGQEFNVILLSTVKSSDLQNDYIYKLGFVSNPRRLNVSITRAKALLIVVGNPQLLSTDTYWRTLIDYCCNKGLYVGCKI